MENWFKRAVLIVMIGFLFSLVLLEKAELSNGLYYPYGETEDASFIKEEIAFYPQDLDLMLEIARKEEKEDIIELLEGLEEEVKKYSPEKTIKRFVAHYELRQWKYWVKIEFEDGTSEMYEDLVWDHRYEVDALKDYAEIAQQRIGITVSSSDKEYESSYYRGEGRVDIRLRIRVFNYTDRDIFFTFISNQRFEVIIEDEDGEEVWRFSQGKHFWIYPRGRFDVERIPAKGEKVYEVHIKSFKLGNFKVRVKYLSQEPLKEAETRFTVQYMSPDYY